MSEHSIIPPSGADIWRICQQWITMNQIYPSEEDADTKDGIAAHWVITQADREFIDETFAPNGQLITDEMIEGANLFWDTVDADGHEGIDLHIEKQIDIHRIHEKCFGTPDLWFYDHSKKLLRIYDYKFGHKYIDPYINYQCIAYYAGIAELIFDGDDLYKWVEIIIIQPRCYHQGSAVKRWLVRAVDLRPYVTELNNAAAMILDGGEKILTSTTNEGCDNCTGRHACGALQKYAYKAAEISLKSIPIELPSEAASLELRMLETSLSRLKARVEGLKENVLAMGKQGKPIPHHALEQSIGRLNWIVNPEQVIAIGKLFDINLEKPDTVTPTQALKLGLHKSIIDANAVRNKGEVKLIEFNSNSVSKIFGE